MRKWMIAGTILIFLFVMVVLALLSANSLINRNRDYLVKRAEQALGRKVSVGKVGISLWNGIGVRLNDFSLSDDASFSSGHFIRAQDLQVNLKIIPLLSKEVEIKRLILNKPIIGVRRSKNGTFNFASLGGTGKEKAPAGKTREPPKEKVTALPLLVSLVDISDGDVHYVDRKEGIDLRIKKIDFRVKDLNFDKPFSVYLAAALFSEKQNFEVQTLLGPVGPQTEMDQIPVEGSINVDPIDFGRLTSAAPIIKALLPKDLKLTGPLRIKETRLKGTLKKLALAGTVEGTDTSIQFGKNFRKDSGIMLIVSFAGEMTNNNLSFQQAKVTLQGLELVGKGKVKLGIEPFLNLSVDSNQFSLKGWEKIIPPIRSYQLSGNAKVQTKVNGRWTKGTTPRINGTMTLSGVNANPPQSPQPLKDLSANVNFTGNGANFKETTLTLGRSRIRLEAEIKRFSPLRVSYKFFTPEIWPTDFQVNGPAERKADVIKNLSSTGQLNVKNGNLNYQGKLTSGQGTFYNIAYKKLGAGLVLENKVATIRDFRVNALKGSLEAQGTYSYRNPVPSFSLASKIRGLDLKELYRALDPKAPQVIQGNLNANLKVAGSGKAWKEIEPRLRGEGNAEVIDGALLNFNLAEGIILEITGIPGLTSLITPQVPEQYPEIFQSKDTKFKELKALFSLGDSRMNVKDLTITAADFTILGKGRVLFNRKTDFRSLILFSQQLSADLARAAREMKYIYNQQNRLEIPFVLNGTLPNVRPKPDSNFLAKLVQRGAAGKGAEEISKQIFGSKEPSSPQESKERDAVQDLIRKGLQGIFGR